MLFYSFYLNRIDLRILKLTASYDGLLRLQLPEESSLVGYTDDVAVLVVVRNLKLAQLKLHQVMRRVSGWMEEHGFA